MNKWQYFTYKDGVQNDNKNLQTIISSLPKPIVFTNGVFDILHIGHVKYLYESKKFGGSLIVGINSDESTKLLNKGPQRPINPHKERAKIISSLKMVDMTIIFDEETPINLIKLIMPQIYTKGEDYNLQTIPFLDVLKQHNIETKFIPLIKGKASTNLINKININL